MLIESRSWGYGKPGRRSRSGCRSRPGAKAGTTTSGAGGQHWRGEPGFRHRGELCLVPIKLPPIDVPMVILEQDLPVFKGSAVAVALAGAAIDDLDPLLAWLLSAFGVVRLDHATRPATRALSRALPRRRAL